MLRSLCCAAAMAARGLPWAPSLPPALLLQKRLQLQGPVIIISLCMSAGTCVVVHQQDGSPACI